MNVTFVLEGVCSVYQDVSYVTRKEGLNLVKVPLLDSKLNANEKRVDLKLEIQKIGCGDFFPALPVLGSNANMVKYLGSDFIEKKAYNDYYERISVDLDDSTISPFSIKAETPLVLATITFSDLVQMASREALYSLVFEPSVFHFPASELVESHLNDLRWEQFRKREIREYRREHKIGE